MKYITRGKYLFLCVALSICLSLIFYNCSNTQRLKPIVFEQNDYKLQLPLGFDSIPVPDGNEMSLVRIELGKRLFFDPGLSLDSTVSCASCHAPAKYFTDGLSRSKGINGLEVDRNAPSLYNVAYHPYFLREGGVPTLEMQVLVPIQEHREFNYNILDLSYRLRKDSHYVALADSAYNREIDPFVITRAISAFERTLISGNSPFDRFFYQGVSDAVSRDVKKGYKLFISERLKCVECHSGFNFTNYEITNNGLYLKYKDPGKARVTNQPEDSACFKVPSLRNVSVTAPYMHDGSLKTLDAVIRHYESGGANHPNKSKLIKGFDLTNIEREQLKAFLNALTDDSVVTSKP